MENNIKNRFDGRALTYYQSRPDYAPAIFSLFEMLNINKKTVVADIGAGTGIVSKIFLEQGCYVYSVEPNHDMHCLLKEQLKCYSLSKIIQSTAEETKIKSHSVDIVIAGQAFHWFNPDKFKKECTRILRYNGYIILLWNCFDDASPSIKAVENCFKQFNHNFHGFNAGINQANIKKVIPHPVMISYDNNLTYNKEKFIKRFLSSSFSLTPNHSQYIQFIRTLERTYDSFSQDDNIILNNKTVVYIGKL